MPDDKEPYTVEIDRAACEHCGEGTTWMVVDPDGVGDSTSFLEQEDAEHLARALNAAFERGRKSACG
jgi:hypothetical protein